MLHAGIAAWRGGHVAKLRVRSRGAGRARTAPGPVGTSLAAGIADSLRRKYRCYYDIHVPPTPYVMDLRARRGGHAAPLPGPPRGARRENVVQCFLGTSLAEGIADSLRKKYNHMLHRNPYTYHSSCDGPPCCM